jgi:hypothetical protein
LVPSPRQGSKSGLDRPDEVVAVLVVLVVLVVDLELELLPGLENVIDDKALFEVGVEVIVDSLCSSERGPWLVGVTLEEYFDVGVGLREHVHVEQLPG